MLLVITKVDWKVNMLDSGHRLLHKELNNRDELILCVFTMARNLENPDM